MIKEDQNHTGLNERKGPLEAGGARQGGVLRPIIGEAAHPPALLSEQTPNYKVSNWLTENSQSSRTSQNSIPQAPQETLQINDTQIPEPPKFSQMSSEKSIASMAISPQMQQAANVPNFYKIWDSTFVDFFVPRSRDETESPHSLSANFGTQYSPRSASTFATNGDSSAEHKIRLGANEFVIQVGLSDIQREIYLQMLIDSHDEIKMLCRNPLGQSLELARSISTKFQKLLLVTSHPLLLSESNFNGSTLKSGLSDFILPLSSKFMVLLDLIWALNDVAKRIAIIASDLEILVRHVKFITKTRI